MTDKFIAITIQVIKNIFFLIYFDTNKGGEL